MPATEANYATLRKFISVVVIIMKNMNKMNTNIVITIVTSI